MKEFQLCDCGEIYYINTIYTEDGEIIKQLVNSKGNNI